MLVALGFAVSFAKAAESLNQRDVDSVRNKFGAYQGITKCSEIFNSDGKCNDSFPIVLSEFSMLKESDALTPSRSESAKPQRRRTRSLRRLDLSSLVDASFVISCESGSAYFTGRSEAVHRTHSLFRTLSLNYKTRFHTSCRKLTNHLRGFRSKHRN